MTEQELEIMYNQPLPNLHKACQGADEKAFNMWLAQINLAIKMGMVIERRHTLRLKDSKVTTN